ncbi:MAG: hypothetical protein AB7S26_05475 [Sandaracinaceae bacterium]
MTKPTKGTLTDEDIHVERSIGRRGAIGIIGASFATAAAVMASAPETAEAQGCSDSDGGRYADPAGRGRRCGGGGGSGCSDSDGGRYADAAGHGRRCGGGRRGCSDSDGGRYADGAGHGRRCGRSCSDSDGGRYADPAGQGRRC